MHVRNVLEEKYQRFSRHLFTSESQGYWSHLDKEESEELVRAVQQEGTREAIERFYPDLLDLTFSPRRVAGMELLDIKGDEHAIDCGCMWGALTVPLAKRCAYVLGVDQTLSSLRLLGKRLQEEEIDNVDLLCIDLCSFNGFEKCFDIAVVNGVLEWIPDRGDFELKKHYGRHRVKESAGNPRAQQMAFLKSLKAMLRKGGKLYLAIENRYDYKMFLGRPDHHAGVLFTSILPRWAADYVCKKTTGRKYVNWTYSFGEMDLLLKEVGFSSVELYGCLPNYRTPLLILPFDRCGKGMGWFRSVRDLQGRISIRKVAGRVVESLLFNWIGARQLIPSMIAVAQK